MAYKILIAGILLLFAQTLFAADVASDTGTQTAQPSAEQTDDKSAQSTSKDAQKPKDTNQEPAAEESEPDCE